MKERWKNVQQDIQKKKCESYFRSQPVFGRLLRGFRDKYESYGSFAGKVTLRNLTAGDIEALEGFFQKNFHGKKAVTISAELFARALAKSRFTYLMPKEVLELFFQEEMTGKKEQRRAEEDRWLQVYDQLQSRYEGTTAGEWLQEVQEGRRGISSYIRKQYREAGEDIREAYRLLNLGCEILQELPMWKDQMEYLAVFAAERTGNPHAFDDGTTEGTLLYLLVKWILAHEEIRIPQSRVFPLMQKQRAYLETGILRDDISNYAILCGIRAWNRDGRSHAGMEGFLAEGHMVQVPLSVIAEWGRLESPNGEVYIVENPSVYALLCGRWKGKHACMCMNGQPRLSSLLVLELLARAGVRAYYAGDFDPEGLLIAQKLKQYYGADFSYWHMGKTDYEKSLSKERISDHRLKSLAQITDEELRDVAQELTARGVAGYQENIWKEYMECR